MSVFRILLLLFAVLAACIAAGLVYVWMPDTMPEMPVALRTEETKTKPVIVAREDLKRGQTITSDNIKAKDWPEDALPDGAIIGNKSAPVPPGLLGRRVLRPVAPGEPLLESHLIPDGRTSLMAASLKPDRRAFAMTFSLEQGAGGFILPGDRVDVIATKSYIDPKGTRHATSKTLIEGIEVLAVAKTIDAESKTTLDGATITLAVTPEEAESLAKAAAVGRVDFALRGFGAISPKRESGEIEGNTPKVTRTSRIYRNGRLSETKQWSASGRGDQ